MDNVTPVQPFEHTIFHFSIRDATHKTAVQCGNIFSSGYGRVPSEGSLKVVCDRLQARYVRFFAKTFLFLFPFFFFKKKKKFRNLKRELLPRQNIPSPSDSSALLSSSSVSSSSKVSDNTDFKAITADCEVCSGSDKHAPSQVTLDV